MSISRNGIPPILAQKHNPSAFTPGNLLREARWQYGSQAQVSPPTCFPDPDADIVRSAIAPSGARIKQLYSFSHIGIDKRPRSVPSGGCRRNRLWFRLQL